MTANAGAGMAPPAAGAGIRSLDLHVEVETPEQIAFQYTIAGVGSRAVALLIDYAICFVPMLVVLVFFVALRAPGARGPDGGWIIALLIAAQFAVFWGYHVLFEGLWDGQTPGKRRMGLRVVQDGGYPVTFAVAAVRNLARALDMQPGFAHAVAAIAAILSGSGKRLGDMLAGTIVVREQLVPLRAEAGGERGVVPTPVLTDDAYGVLQRWIERRNALDPDRRRALAASLAGRLGVIAEPGTTPMAALARLHERERAARAAGAAGRGATGATRERHRIIAQGIPRWSAFAAQVARVQHAGMRRLSERELEDFVATYRTLAADLARLRTASGDRPTSEVFALSRLVAAGHNLIYRRAAVPASAIWRYLVGDFPAEVRRSALAVTLAAVLLFLPMGIAYVAVVRQPSLALRLLPADMLDRAEAGVGRARQDGGYIEVSEAMRPVISSAIIANNVQVTYVVFAMGLTAGIGTVFMLVVNGAAIGSAIGLYATKAIPTLILGFVAAHGVLELSAIVIAGAAGLIIASAFLLPGALTRREALVLRGRRAVRLIGGTTAMLVLAGLIEGMISASHWPVEAKALVSVSTALLLWLWLSSGRVRARPGP